MSWGGYAVVPLHLAKQLTRSFHSGYGCETLVLLSSRADSNLITLPILGKSRHIAMWLCVLAVALTTIACREKMLDFIYIHTSSERFDLRGPSNTGPQHRVILTKALNEKAQNFQKGFQE